MEESGVIALENPGAVERDALTEELWQRSLANVGSDG